MKEHKNMKGNRNKKKENDKNTKNNNCNQKRENGYQYVSIMIK